MRKANKIFLSLLLLLPCYVAMGQQMTPAEQERKMYEAIQKEVDRYTDLLSLETWQIFYADSILTHDYGQMQKEVESLSKSKVSNTDMYLMVQDKWSQATYEAFKKILSEEQWIRYEKTGAAKARKDREKRAQKRNQQL